MKKTVGIFVNLETDEIKTFKVTGSNSGASMKQALETSLTSGGEDLEKYKFIGKYVKVFEDKKEIEIEL